MQIEYNKTIIDEKRNKSIRFIKKRNRKKKQ